MFHSIEYFPRLRSKMAVFLSYVFQQQPHPIKVIASMQLIAPQAWLCPGDTSSSFTSASCQNRTHAPVTTRIQADTIRIMLSISVCLTDGLERGTSFWIRILDTQTSVDFAEVGQLGHGKILDELVLEHSCPNGVCNGMSDSLAN